MYLLPGTLVPYRTAPAVTPVPSLQCARLLQVVPSALPCLPLRSLSVASSVGLTLDI